MRHPPQPSGLPGPRGAVGEADPELADAPAWSDPADETVDYHHAAPAIPDGFPEVDDLAESHFGQYRMDRVIGRGSMARVYGAEHLGLGRSCAIKVMNPGLVRRQPDIVDRFRAEARAVAHLVHPHVVTVHNLGSDRGYHFIEMEFIPGGVSLNEALIREGPLPPLRATTVVSEVVQALGAAHRTGLIHRDVKPANVLLTAVGTAKLADFGLVHRPNGLSPVAARLAGTPSFMAPELFGGAEADARTDLYAVGVMYHYLLSGRLPFAADRLERIIALHRSAPVPDLRAIRDDVPDEVAGLVRRLLAKAPAERPGSANELEEQLQEIIDHLRDIDDLVRDALEGLPVHIQPSGPESYRVVVPLATGRLQEVYLESAAGRHGERLLTVFSVCAPADSAHFEFALRLNAEMTHGSLSIRNVAGQPMFVMTRTFLRRHVGAGDLRAAVLEIARRGDAVEQALTSTDVY